MSAIIRVGELSFGFDVRDLAFWDEETVILVTPAADVWRAVLDPHPRAVEKLFSGREVNAPLSAAFGKPVEPATGGYPRLAASARAGTVVVNTHDVVLVACPIGIDAGKPRLISEGWGNYDPQIAFSPDGARFSLMSGGVAVFDTTTWKFGHDEAAGTCVWHPRAPWTLVLDEGRVGWIDWTDVAKPARHSIGTLEGPEDREGPGPSRWTRTRAGSWRPTTIPRGWSGGGSIRCASSTPWNRPTARS